MEVWYETKKHGQRDKNQVSTGAHRWVVSGERSEWHVWDVSGIFRGIWTVVGWRKKCFHGNAGVPESKQRSDRDHWLFSTGRRAFVGGEPSCAGTFIYKWWTGLMRSCFWGAFLNGKK